MVIARLYAERFGDDISVCRAGSKRWSCWNATLVGGGEDGEVETEVELEIKAGTE